MTSFETVYLVESHSDRGEDRIAVIADGDRTVIVVADGAGGTGSGDVAADTLVREIRSVCSRIETADQWAHELRQLDFRIPAGESTVVVVDLRLDRIIGASVGDSAAWIIDEGNVFDLTRNQVRKPLLGSQQARPVAFTHQPLSGTLLVGTDGFFNYAKRDAVPPVVSRSDFFSIPRKCLEMVRLPSGQLWDDVAIVACRVRRAPQSRKRYSL
ncbi:protein phosphatase 2C domain-containing protein [Novipirellula sp. SH528]|uniref:protein phosphatase 2C domain-containing protein n=1 Tax=Novipirellula sp. SH528 TaxID=3454466 RepID=UPI003F9F8785